MLKIDADHFTGGFWLLGQLIAGQLTETPSDGEPARPSVLTPPFVDFRSSVEALGQPLLLESTDRLLGEFTREKVSLSKLKERVRELQGRLHDYLKHEHLLIVETSDRPYYSLPQPVLGGALDSDADSLEDAIEAGQCIALGRSTAAVFHLMRILERFVWAVGDKLHATVKDEHGQFLTWGVILANIGAEIKKMPKGDAKTKWSEAHALLVAVNIAWRTPTMHPKQTYTPEHAKDIFNATSAFVRYLAPLLHASP